MARWGARIAGILILLVFALLMLNLYKQLKMLAAEQRPAATTTSPAR